MSAIGIIKTIPLAINKQPINVGRDSTKRITARILARPQETLKTRPIALMNSQPKIINANNSNIFLLLFSGTALKQIYMNADLLCIGGVMILFF